MKQMVCDKIQEDNDKEYIGYLKTFSISRKIKKHERNNLLFEEATQLKDIQLEKIQKDKTIYVYGKITKKGYEKLPWFWKLLSKIFNSI